jgi:hypothetical protein
MATVTKNRNFFKWPKLLYFKEGGHPRIISAKFGLDWFSSFRGEDFFLISSPLFSNLHNLSQNVPKFELYKHNDELFNKYYRIFYEL